MNRVDAVQNPPPAPTSEPGGFASLDRRQLVLTIAGLMLTLLLAAMDQTIVGTALPSVIKSLNGFDRYPWVTTSYLLSSTIAMPVLARLSDLYGRKWFYLFGTVLFVLCSWLCGAAGNLPLPLDGMNQLILCRGLQGIGAGAIMGLSFTIVGDLFAPAERGKYQGLFSAVFGLAAVIGPVLGGWITDHFSWRWAFYVNAPLGVLAVGVLYFTFPNFRPTGRRRVIDWLGLLALAAWTVPLLLGLSGVSQNGWTARHVQVLFATAAVMLLIFLLIEARAVEPILPLTLFRDSTVRLAATGIFLLGMGMFCLFLYFPLFLQGVRGQSAMAAGSLFVPLTLAMVCASIFSGQLIARTGRYKVFAVCGAAIATVGIFLLARMDASVSQAVILRNVLICGIGLGTMQPIYTLVVQNVAPPGQMGAATALTLFCRSIGSTIGVAVFGSILLHIYHNHLADTVPAGTSPDLLSRLANPLQLLQRESPLVDAAAIPPAVLAGVRSGLAAGLYVIFLLSSAVLAGALLVNACLRETPLRKTRH